MKRMKEQFVAHSWMEGDHVPNSQDLLLEGDASLAAIGADPLAGSGFEAEESEPGFGPPELSGDKARHRQME